VTIFVALGAEQSLTRISKLVKNVVGLGSDATQQSLARAKQSPSKILTSPASSASQASPWWLAAIFPDQGCHIPEPLRQSASALDSKPSLTCLREGNKTFYGNRDKPQCCGSLSHYATEPHNK